MPAYESQPLSVAYEQTDSILTKEVKNDAPLLPLNTNGLASDAPTPSTALVSSPRLSSPITSMSLFLNNGAPSHETNISSSSVRKAIHNEDIICYSSRSSDSKASSFILNPVDIAIVGNSIPGMITAIALYEKHNSNVHLFITNDTQDDIMMNTRILDALYCINPDLYVKVLDALQLYDKQIYHGNRISCANLHAILGQYIEATYGGISIHSHGHLLHIHPEAFQKERTIEVEGTEVSSALNNDIDDHSSYDRVNQSDIREAIAVNKDIYLYFEDGAECKAKLVILTDRANLHTLQLLSSPKDPNQLLCLELYGTCRNIPTALSKKSGAWIIKSNILEATMTIKDHFIHWSINQKAFTAGFDFEGSLALPKMRKDQASIFLEEIRTKIENQDKWFVDSMKEVVASTIDIDLHYQFFENPISQTWRYFEDQIILLGEAAHQTSRSMNTGLALAIEDAIQLGYCLVDNDCRQTALERYESIRRDYEFRSPNYKVGHKESEAMIIHIPMALDDNTIFVPTREIYSKCKPELLDQAENEAEYM